MSEPTLGGIDKHSDTIKSKSFKVLEWFRSHVKNFLDKVQPEKVQALERDAQNLQKVADATGQELSVCFLGDSGVGKSTLINSLVAGKDIILPAGGVGPLTAQALAVRYDVNRRFEVEYHPAKTLRQLVFALDMFLQRNQRKIGLLAASDDIGDALTDEEKASAEALVTDDSAEQIDNDDIKLSDKLEELKRQAQLLVTGNQQNDTDLKYLVDALREVTGSKRTWGTLLKSDDEQRLRHIKEAITWNSDQKGIRTYTAQNPEFKKALGDHASGFLAPLIRELRVFWDSPMLAQGVTLVDLPGVGILNDMYEATTKEWIRGKAQTVILVVNTKGIQRVHAELLRSSGFLSRLLYSADDPAAVPLVLIVAVVRCDDVAETRYSENKLRKKSEHLNDVRIETIAYIRQQLRIELENLWISKDQTNDDSVRPIKKDVIDTILNCLQVHPVSAPQYRKFLENDDEDRSFIREESESGIPGLIDGLSKLAINQRNCQNHRLKEVGDDFFQRAVATVNVIQASWLEDNRASEETDKLKLDLDKFINPLREEFKVREGAFRECFRETLPTKIRALVQTANEKSTTAIDNYLSSLRNTYWSTLRAAVRRGGAFDGSRKIDLPNDLAVEIDEPIAEVWGRSILKEIRKKTTEFANDCVSFVDQVVDWAKNQGGRVKKELVEALQAEINAGAKRLETVGKDMVNDLRKRVNQTLILQIEVPIRLECNRFVENGNAIGPGVKCRMIELFTSLARNVTAASVPIAIDILTSEFRKVEEEILSVFEQHKDPLKSASEAIVASHELITKRSNAQRRKGVLAEAEAVMAELPWELSPEAICQGENS